MNGLALTGCPSHRAIARARDTILLRSRGVKHPRSKKYLLLNIACGVQVTGQTVDWAAGAPAWQESPAVRQLRC